ncbi:Band 4-like protein isoform 1 [Schistosoma japonicum]|uniref:Band 4-like protein isoform 1 n=1 Tax=Schistosoma japonicum TaxID=6182 RepID=A0A4Z2CYX0_SCHJA|nr:Band 4-like protein isoform 1 [Schistosoma japonicum]
MWPSRVSVPDYFHQNNHSPEFFDCSDDVWQLRNQTTSDFSKGLGTTSSAGVTNLASSPSNTSNRSLICGFSPVMVGESNVLASQNNNTANHKAKHVQQSLKSFLRKATSLKDSRSNQNIQCIVIGLDGKCFRFNVHKFAFGRELFDLVCQCLEVEESQYFGLAYYLNRSATINSMVGIHRDEQSSSDLSFRLSSSSIDDCYSNKFCGFSVTNSFNPCTMYSNNTTTYPGFNPFFIDVPFWLDVEKRITDQCPGSKLIFYFQVKFYPQHPDLVFECPKSRRQFCLQLRYHLRIGRLLCSFETHVILGALIAQMDLGDAVKHHRSRSGHSSCRSNIPFTESSSHDFSRRQSISPTRSFSSERRCSLAQPEHSDDSIVWDSRVNDKFSQDKLCSLPDGNKTRTLNHIGCSCSTQQIDNISMMYLQCLPHLARRSITSSSIHQNTNDISNGSRPSLLSTTLNNIEDVLLSPLPQTFSPGWPYPKSDCRYCPVLLSRVARLHKKFRGMLQKDAEILFLRNVKKMSFYGVELHPIKKFHASYISSGSFKNITKKLIGSFYTRPRACSVESYHNFLDNVSVGSSQLLNSDKTHNSLSISGLKSSLRRFFSVKYEGPPLFPFAFNDFPSFDFSLGVYYAGLFLQWGHLRLSHYTWSSIVKIYFHLDEFCLVLKTDKTKSSSPRILLKCKFAFQKLARRFYRACVEHHIFFKIHSKRILHSNIVKRQPCKPVILPLNHMLHVDGELNPSVSINGPCSIEQLSVSNLQSPKLPTTPTWSESELDTSYSSKAQSNHPKFYGGSTQLVNASQMESTPQTNIHLLEDTCSNSELLVPSTSNAASATRSASFTHLDATHSTVDIASPIECSSRLDIADSSVNYNDNDVDKCTASTNVPLCHCLPILGDKSADSADCLCRITPTSANLQLSFDMNDKSTTDALLTHPANPNAKSSDYDICQTLLTCEIPNLLPNSIPVNCNLPNPVEECFPTDMLHNLLSLHHISSDSSQVELMKPVNSLWCNVFPSVDLNPLNKFITPSYLSLISPNGEIIRLNNSSTNTTISKSSTSCVPCDFLPLNTTERQVNTYDSFIYSFFILKIYCLYSVIWSRNESTPVNYSLAVFNV